MAALAPELLVLRDVMLPLVGMNNTGPVNNRQTSQFIALHGFQSIEDFNLIEPNQARDLVKALNGQRNVQHMGVLVLNNLTGLIWHVKDMTRHGLNVVPDAITANDLHNSHLAYEAYEAYVQNKEKGTT